MMKKTKKNVRNKNILKSKMVHLSVPPRMDVEKRTRKASQDLEHH